MAEKKPENEEMLSISKYISESYKSREYELYVKFKPDKKPEKKRSLWNSVWVWFLMCLGINFIAGDPIGFTKSNSDQGYCEDRVVPKSERHKPSRYDNSGDCSL